jgi:WS/DGAT/MGAT family acyltransferase
MSRSRERMSLLDATFLRIETPSSPMHVASLQIFKRPEGSGSDFVRDIVATFRAHGRLTQPFGLKLASGLLSPVNPSLIEAADVDLEYHVRHSSLPEPGGERELGELISHLHGGMLDRSRPLWTCHVIEGLADDRFAIYVKIHHALTDGVGGMRLLTQALATEPDGAWSAPWNHQSERPSGQRSARRWPGGELVSVPRTAFSLARGVAGLLRRGSSEPVRVPFEAPTTVLNGAITAARRVATQQLELDRVQAVADATETTVNDVLLAICGTALRRHLNDSGMLPDRSLVAGVPVSLRQPGETTANAVGMLWAGLSTDVDDPRTRLQAIHESMDATKTHLLRMSPEARKVFTLSMMAPVIAVLLGGLGARLRPPMNVTISNVPGPRTPLYLNGARLEAFYPVSIALQGQTLNITCVTYDGTLNLGISGCRDSLPHLQRLAVFAHDALDELEATVERPTSAQLTKVG